MATTKDEPVRNWAGNITFQTTDVRRPTTIAEAQSAVARARNVRVLGSRHSFNRIADAEVLIDPSGLTEICEIDATAGQVRVSGSMTYGRLASLLKPAGLTLSNCASLPHISIAGAVATGTHGSGDRNQNLGGAVAAVELITGSGDIGSYTRGNPDFGGAVVSLGALGMVTALTLDVVPMFEVAQTVYDAPPIERTADSLDVLLGAAYSVSVFTRFDGGDQIWIKQKAGEETPADATALLGELLPASQQRHPILGEDGAACTAQLGTPGPAIDRLPHFRLDFAPSVGDEIQSEFFVPRRHGADAVRAVASAAHLLADTILVAEVRSVAADSQWMSPHRDRDSVALHFTWRPDRTKAAAASRVVAEALAPFAPRAHWGKVFAPEQFDLGEFPDRDRFVHLVHSIDPTRTFINEWFASVIER